MSYNLYFSLEPIRILPLTFTLPLNVEIPELKLTAVCTEVPAFVFIIIPSFPSKNVVPRLSPSELLVAY